jgi:hypothetical protein
MSWSHKYPGICDKVTQILLVCTYDQIKQDKATQILLVCPNDQIKQDKVTQILLVCPNDQIKQCATILSLCKYWI